MEAALLVKLLLITFTSLSYLSLYLYTKYYKKKQLGGLGRAVL